MYILNFLAPKCFDVFCYRHISEHQMLFLLFVVSMNNIFKVHFLREESETFKLNLISTTITTCLLLFERKHTKMNL